MHVDKEIIEQFIFSEKNAEYLVDPLLTPNLSLMRLTAAEIDQTLNRDYDFSVPGQAALWASSLATHCSKVDVSLTQIIARFWSGDYDVFKRAKPTAELLHAVTFEAVVAGLIMVKALPFFIEGYEVPEDIKSSSLSLVRFLGQYKQIISPQLVFDPEFGPTNTAYISFQSVHNLLPEEIIAVNPIEQATVDPDYIYTPILSVGLIASNFLRDLNAVLLKIIAGDRHYLTQKKDEIKMRLYIALNAINLITASGVFYPTLSLSMDYENLYKRNLQNLNVEHSAERFDRWLSMAIPLSTASATAIFNLTTC